MAEQENTWVTFPKTQPIPIDLSEIIDPIDKFFETINTILNVTLEILSFVEAFITSLLDPILATLQAIIRLLKALLADLDQLGLYYTGDFDLILSQQYDQLKGGYIGFQQRMIKKWLAVDPSKPDFKASGAVAIYIYGSTNFVEGIEPIVNAINLILKLFKQEKDSQPILPAIGELTLNVTNEDSQIEQLGLVEKDKILTNKIKENDLVLAVPSNGLHSNGYSLVRHILKKILFIFIF